MTRFGWRVIAVMCFRFLYNLFTELTVHAYNMFTHLILAYTFNYYEFQGCSPSDWLKCAGVVAECVAQCAEGNTSQARISRTCLESSYEQCKNCTEAIQKQGLFQVIME